MSTQNLMLKATQTKNFKKNTVFVKTRLHNLKEKKREVFMTRKKLKKHLGRMIDRLDANSYTLFNLKDEDLVFDIPKTTSGFVLFESYLGRLVGWLCVEMGFFTQDLKMLCDMLSKVKKKKVENLFKFNDELVQLDSECSKMQAAIDILLMMWMKHGLPQGTYEIALINYQNYIHILREELEPFLGPDNNYENI